MTDVAIYTLRDGEPYVLFGTRIMTPQTVKTYFIEDGPHIEKWEALLRQMEADGVTMLSDD